MGGKKIRVIRVWPPLVAWTNESKKSARNVSAHRQRARTDLQRSNPTYHEWERTACRTRRENSSRLAIVTRVSVERSKNLSHCQKLRSRFSQGFDISFSVGYSPMLELQVPARFCAALSTTQDAVKLIVAPDRLGSGSAETHRQAHSAGRRRTVE